MILRVRTWGAEDGLVQTLTKLVKESLQEECKNTGLGYWDGRHVTQVKYVYPTTYLILALPMALFLLHQPPLQVEQNFTF